MLEEGPRVLPAGPILALRGALTRDLLGAPGKTPLGDPGLLVGRFTRRLPQHYSIGVVPHLSHFGIPTFRSFVAAVPGSVLVDVAGSPDRVIRTVSRCGAIVTSSLHGLVIADAFGIPATWVMPEPLLLGGSFKFRDYLSAFGAKDGRQTDADDVAAGTLNLGTVSASAVQVIQDCLLSQVPRFSAPRA